MDNRIYRTKDELMHCVACGSLTNNGQCDCTKGQTGTQKLEPYDELADVAAGRIFCHAQFKGDDYTSRQLAKDILAPATAEITKLVAAILWAEVEIGLLRTAFRVNMLRDGHTDAEIDAVLAACERKDGQAMAASGLASGAPSQSHPAGEMPALPALPLSASILASLAAGAFVFAVLITMVMP